MNKVRKFFSRRNKVYLITDGQKPLIYKQYSNAEARSREKANLELLAAGSVAVPQIEGEADRALLLSYLDGMTYEQVLRKFEQGVLSYEQTADAITALLKWLEGYFAATGGALRGDINLRNFIYLKDKTCAGVDFEDTLIYGDMCQEIGRLLAFIATYDPPFSDKKLLIGAHILMCLDISLASFAADFKDKIADAYRSEIAAMNRRRADFAPLAAQADRFWQQICSNI